MIATPQLPLALKPVWRYRFEDFIPGPNLVAVDTLTALAADETDVWPFISGPSGSGKTHLLCALVAEMDARSQRVAALSADALLANDPGLLQGFSHLDLLAIDDVEQILGKPEWEYALFHLFNELRANGGRLILASRLVPHALEVNLADLRSRLNWGSLLCLQNLADPDKAVLIHQRAYAHGISLDQTVVDYLLRMLPRDLPQLLNHFEKIAEKTLAAKRRLTLPFVRSYLAEL